MDARSRSTRSPGAPAAVLIDKSAGGDEIGQTTGLSDIACPALTSCTAVDGNGQKVTFDPGSPGTPSIVRIDAGNQLVAVSCALQTACTAIDQSQQVTFDPVAPGHPKPTPVFTGFGIGLAGLACPLPTRCVAVRASSELTFNPRSPGKPKQKTIDPVSDIGISDVVCPSATRCVAVDGNGGEVLFDPRTGKPVKPAVFISEGAQFEAVSCPSERQCTIVDNDGGMLTFNPSTGKKIAAATIDSAVGLNAPSGDSSNNLDGVACPTATLCAAVDTLGNAVTFNPRSKHAAKQQAIDPGNSLAAVACPSSTECVAVDSLGRALLGEPPSGAWSVEPVPGATAFTDVTCRSPAECVAVDSAGDAFLGAGHSTAEIKGWLANLLVPRAGAATIGAVLKTGGYKLVFAALYAETVQIRWFNASLGSHVLVASGSISFSKARDATLKIKLTAAGRRLLRRSSKLKLDARGTVTSAGHAVTTTGAFTLSR